MDDHHPDSTFAPQSPDLNAYTDIEPLPPQHQQYRGSISHTLTPFTPTDAKSPWSSHANASYNSTRTPGFGQQQQASYFPPQPQQSYGGSPYQFSRQNTQQQQQQQQQPPTFNQDPFASSLVTFAGADSSWDPMARDKRVKAEPDMDVEVGNGANGSARLDVEVKTKFPVARIKRIMQSDEDVGKVAQVTPVVVSKALELFMIDLVTTAASEAKSRSSKRVTAAHLKQAVMSNAKYSDWLGEIVSKAPDAPTASAKAAKDEGDSDEEFFGGAAPKKKRKAPTRRKKGGDDD